jgi:hypothetical protein
MSSRTLETGPVHAATPRRRPRRLRSRRAVRRHGLDRRPAVADHGGGGFRVPEGVLHRGDGRHPGSATSGRSSSRGQTIELAEGTTGADPAAGLQRPPRRRDPGVERRGRPIQPPRRPLPDDLHAAVPEPGQTGRPTMCASRSPRARRRTQGSRYTLQVWPTPDADYTLQVWYELSPGPLTAEHPIPYGGAPLADLFRAAVIAAYAEKWEKGTAVHRGRGRDFPEPPAGGDRQRPEAQAPVPGAQQRPQRRRRLRPAAPARLRLGHSPGSERSDLLMSELYSPRSPTRTTPSSGRPAGTSRSPPAPARRPRSACRRPGTRRARCSRT